MALACDKNPKPLTRNMLNEDSRPRHLNSANMTSNTSARAEYHLTIAMRAAEVNVGKGKGI